MIMIFGTLVLNDNTSRCLFNFFEIFIFWAVSGDKRAKNCPKWKKKQLHRTSAISQEQYNICSLFLVHLYKMISPGYHFTQVKFCVFHFFIFSKFFNFFFKFLFIRLFGWWWGRRQTFCLLNFMSHKPYMIWPWLMVHMCKRIISLSFWVFFAFFPNFNFWGQ